MKFLVVASKAISLEERAGLRAQERRTENRPHENGRGNGSHRQDLHQTPRTSALYIVLRRVGPGSGYLPAYSGPKSSRLLRNRFVDNKSLMPINQLNHRIYAGSFCALAKSPIWSLPLDSRLADVAVGPTGLGQLMLLQYADSLNGVDSLSHYSFSIHDHQGSFRFSGGEHE